MDYRVCVVGSGYVGLVMAACFASKGIKTACIDIDESKVDMINDGISPIYEPGLDDILPNVVSGGRLVATSDYAEGMEGSDFTFICVGTPQREDGSIDLSHVVSASEDIGRNLRLTNSGHTVVVKSTVIPGTTSRVIAPMLESSSGMLPGRGFNLVSNPEFLKEGSAVYDALYPDRIIIGEHSKGSGLRLLRLYEDFYGENLPPCLTTNTVNAEMIKYANNAFLATKISFINEIANICQRIPGADVEVVAKGIGFDKRIGPLFLRAGLGYAGPCLPKDLSALIQHARSLGYGPRLLDAVQRTNDNQPYYAVELAKVFLRELSGKSFAILGLAFKPNTDDLRGAASIKIIKELLSQGARVKAYDPKAMENARKILKEDGIIYAGSAIDCIKDTDCCIIVTEWDEFKRLKPEDFVRCMREPIVIDGRRVYDPSEFVGKLKYAAIGYSPMD